MTSAVRTTHDAADEAASSFWSARACALGALALAACGGPAPAPPPADTDACGAPASPIHAVQGAGATSPLAGQTVAVEGVVGANFQRGLRGFFVQSADGTQDADPATSEGLFVAVAQVQDAVHPGVRVRARGRVIERVEAEGQREGTTAIELDGSVKVCGEGALPAPIELAQPPADWERYEGMRLALPGPLTATGNYELLRFGRLDVSLAGRLMAPTEVAAPGAGAAAVAARNAQALVQLDDARAIENPRRVWWLERQPSADAPWRVGTTLGGIEGVLDQGFRYRLQLTAPPREVVQAARPAPPEVGGDLRVASFNLLTLFNGDGRGRGFPTTRGATDPDEFARQRDKLVAAIVALRPDVAALMEVENDGYGAESAIAQLVVALNAAQAGAADYRFVKPDTPRLGGDEIAVGLIYDALRIEAVGEAAAMAVTVVGADGEPDTDTRNRLPLMQAFRARGGGTPFTVVANHFKSKTCGDATGADADQRDGQACWNATRTHAAKALLAVRAWLPAMGGTGHVLVIGDLNAYGREDPVRAFTGAGFVDLVGQHATEPAWSFVYDARSGRLDHALATAPLAARVTGAAEWHINADELEAFDFNREGRTPKADARLYRPDPYRSSDHDPLVIGLRAR